MLSKGSTIGIIALSGVCEKEKVNNAAAYFENVGFNVKLSRNIYDQNRYLAGSDDDKLIALYDFFRNPEIDLILCARGGYGAIRLVNKIDYEIIKNNPKPLCGFSDITALLIMIYKKTSLITYHGPMACSDWGNSKLLHNMTVNKNTAAESPSVQNLTLKALIKALEGVRLEFEGNKIYHGGNARGIIWGGNLSTVVSLCGLDFLPDEDFIFFTEDLNEPVYKIDRMFRQLFNMEKFRKNCRGIVLGDFLNVDNRDWLEELFSEFTLPAVSGFKITHTGEKITLPVGRKALLLKNKLVID